MANIHRLPGVFLRKCLFFLTPVLFLSSLLSAARSEQITITTYYPSPSGTYDALSVKRFSVGDTNADGKVNASDVPSSSGYLLVADRLGVGTASPSYPLHVAGTAYSTDGMDHAFKTVSGLQDNRTLCSGIYQNSGDGLYNAAGSSLALASWWHVINMHHQHNNGYNAQIAVPLSASPNDIFFRTSGGGTWTEWRKVLSENTSGNVGIGTTSPQYGKLEITTTASNIGGLTLYRGTGSTARHWINSSDVYLIQRATTDTYGIAIAATGNVGIGTVSPGAKLDVYAGSATWGGWYEALRFSHASHSAITFPAGGLLFGLHSNRNFYWADTTNGWYSMYLTPEGYLTLRSEINGGNTSTGWALGKGAWGPDVWLRLTTTVAGSTYHNFACGPFWANGAQRYDLAEVTPVKREDALEEGDAVVIDKNDGLRVTRSTQAYDTMVYGIISSYEHASMVIGGSLDPSQAKNNKDNAPVALVGRVSAKVSAENGPVRVGDLLTTSNTPGHLMRCGDPSKSAGAVAGKALQPLEKGRGMIKILVTLQ